MLKINNMKNIILFIHQLPQNLVGLVILLWHKWFCKHNKPLKIECDGITYYELKHINDCGVSLGNYIFIDSDSALYCGDDTIHHEHGHQLQSKYLGWLYLIIIGLPSACGNLIDRITHSRHGNKKCWYYKQPWEAWADKLGGVKR